MTVTQTLMEIGTWDVRFTSGIPGHVLDGIGDFALLMVTDTRLAVAQAEALDEPLFRGVILERDGVYGLSGVDLGWYLGSTDGDEPIKGTTQESGFGPWIQALWTSNGPVKVMGDITAKNGLSYRIEAGITKQVTGGINGTPRTALDRVICPQLQAEWRVRTSGEVELFTRATAMATEVVTITADPGGSDPDVTAWRVADLDPKLSDADRRNRMVMRWDNQGTPATSATARAAGLMAYGGAPLEVCEFRSTSSQVALEVVAERDFRYAVSLIRGQHLDVKVADPNPVGMLADPGGMIGSAAAVYLPDIGVYDTSKPAVQYRGRPIYPTPVRITEVRWPLTTGMGVYLDARWAGGALVDVTDWVDWEADASTSSTDVTLGLLPRWWDGKPRRV